VKTDGHAAGARQVRAVGRGERRVCGTESAPRGSSDEPARRAGAGSVKRGEWRARHSVAGARRLCAAHGGYGASVRRDCGAEGVLEQGGYAARRVRTEGRATREAAGAQETLSGLGSGRTTQKVDWAVCAPRGGRAGRERTRRRASGMASARRRGQA
jgi:hypothetical protein